MWAVVLAGLLTLAGLTWRGMRHGESREALAVLASPPVPPSNGGDEYHQEDHGRTPERRVVAARVI